MTKASEIFARAQVILLDFDGPVCSVFATLAAPEAARRMLAALADAGFELPEWLSLSADPHSLLADLSHVLPEPGLQVAEDALTTAEIEAVDGAASTPGLLEFLDRLGDRSYAIVSNNAADCVNRYVKAHLGHRPPAVVVGRPHGKPSLMKPSPYLLTAALGRLDRQPDDAVFIGDSVSDIDAGIAAGVTTIGYANKPGKAEAQADAGAAAVVAQLRDLWQPA